MYTGDAEKKEKKGDVFEIMEENVEVNGFVMHWAAGPICPMAT